MKEQMELKQALRGKMDQLRKSLSAQNRLEVSARICDHLFAFIEMRLGRGSGSASVSISERVNGSGSISGSGNESGSGNGSGNGNGNGNGNDSGSGSGVVMTYMPFREEADVYPLTERLWKHSYSVAMPKVDRANKQLDVRYVQGIEDLGAGAWGIMEPNTNTVQVDSLSSIAVIIVPGLAYDKAGGRLGYGGGFYDRFLDRFEQGGMKMPIRIGVCYDEQLIESVPMETHDYAVDAVVTERGIILASSKSS